MPLLSGPDFDVCGKLEQRVERRAICVFSDECVRQSERKRTRLLHLIIENELGDPFQPLIIVGELLLERPSHDF